MVELTMMGRLLEAMRPETRLVLVGDPEQLTSVGAGAVLSDLVAGYDGAPDSPVAALADEPPLRAGHQGARRGAARRRRRRRARRCCGRRPTRSRSSRPTTSRDRRGAPAATAGGALDVRARGRRPGDARRRDRRARPAPPAVRAPRGALRRTPLEPPGRALARRGRRASTIYGAVVRRPAAAGDHQRLRARTSTTARPVSSCRQDRRRRAFDRRRPSGSSEFAPGRLDAVETMHAMTIHKSQGSQADGSPCCCPTTDSPAADPRAVLHRGDPRAAARAGGRHRGGRARGRRHHAQRATGLRQRLLGLRRLTG